jgi:phenylalanyl-tRNA synthetase alpha chain
VVAAQHATPIDMTDDPTPALDLAALAADGAAAIAGAASLDALAQVEIDLLGKRSSLAGAHRSLGGLDPEARKEVGRQLHELRGDLEAHLSTRRLELAALERSALLVADRLDLTEVIPAQVRSPLDRGHLHLVSQARDELEDVFVGMGFVVAEGPEAETDWYNFEALNLPPAHPARSMHDTMYLDIGQPETVLLRTHTSPVQIHLMEQAVLEGTLHIHAVMPGKCFRLDTPDATHLPVFNQIEGLVVDRGITFGDLAGTIHTFTQAYFGGDIDSRLRPAYFPFTEPSAEYEITCVICRGQGCRTCSNTGWIELGGCGMVDPAVFAAVGIDAEEWSGFAFGFGIDRLALMRHEIPDLRSFIENDIRFLSQF